MLANPPPPGDSYRVAVSKYALTQKIPPGAPFWSDFNGSFKNYCLTPDNLAAAVYAGHAFTTWHRNRWRTTENYECGQHLGLDFDTCDQSATLGVLSKDKFVARYGSLIYTTLSHTAEEPRARVVFLLDTPIMQAQNYALAAQALLWLFGTADPKCKDPVRFFYGAQGCEMLRLDNVLPLSIVKDLIAKYRETGRHEKRQRERPTDTPPEQSEVQEALDRINPWAIDYDEWVSVLMALHAEYGDGALGMAESWAAGADGEVARKWRSFHPNGNPAGKVTIATVFGLAKRFGWQYHKAVA